MNELCKIKRAREREKKIVILLYTMVIIVNKINDYRKIWIWRMCGTTHMNHLYW